MRWSVAGRDVAGASYPEPMAADPTSTSARVQLAAVAEAAASAPEEFAAFAGLSTPADSRAAAVLILMLGTLIAAGLPLLMAVIGVGVGVGGTMALSGVVVNCSN